MPGVYGADVAQMRELSHAFDRAAQSLGEAKARIGGGIRIAAWVGPFAVRFRTTWDTEHSRQVAAAGEALRAAAEAIRRNADDQESTSRADGAGTRSASGGILPGAIHSVTAGLHGAAPLDLDKLRESAETILGGLNALKVPHTGAIKSTLDYIGNIASGKATFDDFTEWSSSAIGTIPLPVATLGSQAISLYALIGRELTKVDFSDVGGGIMHGLTHPQDVLASYVDAASVVTSTVMGEGSAPGEIMRRIAARTSAAAASTDYSPSAVAATANYAASHPTVVVEEVAKATVAVGSDIVNGTVAGAKNTVKAVSGGVKALINLLPFGRK